MTCRQGTVFKQGGMIMAKKKQIIGGPLEINGRVLSLSRAIRAGDFVFLLYFGLLNIQLQFYLLILKLSLQ